MLQCISPWCMHVLMQSTMAKPSATQCLALAVVMCTFPSTCFSLCHLQVATEGDAFTMAFHDPIDAIAWALNVQHRLLMMPWPAEILEQPECTRQTAPDGTGPPIFSGLRVRMAIHTGKPDSIQVCPHCTHRSYRVSACTHRICSVVHVFICLSAHNVLPDQVLGSALAAMAMCEIAR